MKKYLKLFLGLLLLPEVVFAGFDLNSWQYTKQLKLASFSGSQAVSFGIDQELMAGMKNQGEDLRIVDDQNKEIPYRIQLSRPYAKAEQLDGKILRNVRTPKQGTQVIFDAGSAGRQINQLKFVAKNKNFQRNVAVWGSDDNKFWELLVKNTYTYDYTDVRAGVSLQKTDVQFNTTLYRYYKLEISDPDGDPIIVQSLSGQFLEQAQGQEIRQELKFLAVENHSEKQSEIIINAENISVPMEAVLLQAEAENFNRQVTIYSSDDKKQWSFAGNAYIFRYNTPKFVGEQLRVALPGITKPYMRLVIKNNDNQPIGVTRVQAEFPERRVQFIAQSDRKYSVYYGNKSVSAPAYDINSYFQYYDDSAILTATLGNQQDNPSFKAAEAPQAKPSLTEQFPYLLPGVFLVISAAMVLLAFRFIKH
jgi:hypothetical protein